MAQVLYATNRFAGDGVTTTFSISFQGGYISKDHVKAFITDANGARTDITLTAGMWVGPFTLNIGQAVPVGSTLTVKRETPKGGPLVDYTNGTRITERNLDIANQQSVFIGAEAHDLFDVAGIADVIAQAESGVVDLVNAAQAAAVAADLSANSAAASANLAAAQVTAATLAAGDSAASAEEAALSALASSVSQNAAAGNAADAYAAQVATETLAASIATSGLGFGAAAYDLGYVSDPNTYFDRDLGGLT